MTEEQWFRFDLTGFLVRPAIITPDEHEPESLPPSTAVFPTDPPVF